MKLKTLAIAVLMAACSKVDNQRKAPEYSVQSEVNKSDIDEIKEKIEKVEKEELALSNDKENLERRLNNLIDEIKNNNELSESERRELEKKIQDIITRVESLETSIASLQTIVSNHSQELLTISILQTDMTNVNSEIEYIKNNHPDHNELQDIVDGINQNLQTNLDRIDTLQTEQGSLADKQAALLLDVQDMEAWKIATENFIDTLKRTDITSAVSDLQLWQRNITQPLENMLGWFRTGEERVKALEDFRIITEKCFKVINDDAVWREDQEAGSAQDACAQVRMKLDKIKLLSEQSEGMANDIELINEKIASVEEGSEEHAQLIKSLNLRQIKNRYDSQSIITPCLGEELRLLISAKDITSKHKLFDSNGYAVSGKLENGEYKYGATCKISVENHYKHPSEIEAEALSLPQNMVLVLPGVCVDDACTDLFGSYDREGQQ